ncbi:MAG: leucyl/phenylalanyl-tRNA--protein transferase [Comamonadaceae bacterium]|nr:leucyl/phenylalanyl-tRNA--protein transferase [Comamonadaceae bacterium]
MNTDPPSLRCLDVQQAFPPVHEAWGADTLAPGLLCAGGDLSVESLKAAYQNGIFPWFSSNQPILWWSPDPRMVLKLADFRLARSLRQILKKFIHSVDCQIRVDSSFEAVIASCANAPRAGQDGTWIIPSMIQAYGDFHRAGFAHSVETWADGEMIGGLYFVAIGQAVFGESMFHRATDGSKIALAALACMCRHFHIGQIDCQQNTRHLASMGAKEIQRSVFVHDMTQWAAKPGPDWNFLQSYWQEVGLATAS